MKGSALDRRRNAAMLQACALASALAATLAFPAVAGGPQAGSAPARPAATAEIEQLIATLGRSGCSFQRNGSWHEAPAAQKHLQRKYEWLRDRDRIVSAEQFIQDGASRSSMTGRAYQVRCPGQPLQASAVWFQSRLTALRAKPARGQPGP